MRVCRNCGFIDSLPWENSRFEFNAEFMRFSEAQQHSELEEICLALVDAPNHEPLVYGKELYYRRGTNGIELYCQLICDFQVSRERKNHGRLLDVQQKEKTKQ